MVSRIEIESMSSHGKWLVITPTLTGHLLSNGSSVSFLLNFVFIFFNFFIYNLFLKNTKLTSYITHRYYKALNLFLYSFFCTSVGTRIPTLRFGVLGTTIYTTDACFIGGSYGGRIHLNLPSDSRTDTPTASPRTNFILKNFGGQWRGRASYLRVNSSLLCLPWANCPFIIF